MQIPMISKKAKKLLGKEFPTIVSFYGGDNYYHESAVTLKNDCERLGLDHVIKEIALSEKDDWPSICRKKVNFYHDKLRELKKPILWIDVDSRINSLPEIMHNAKYDFAAFLRGFNDLNTFNKASFARTWAPSFLFFNYTDGGLALTASIKNAADKFTGKATDDYFLEEGWKHIGSDLAALPIPRKYLSLDDNNIDAYFVFGNSGNVKHYKEDVAQHDNTNYGNFQGKEIAKWLKKIKTPLIKSYLYKKASSLQISDLNVLLELASVGKSFSPDVALRFAVRAAYLYPKKYDSRRIMAEIFLAKKQPLQYKETLSELITNQYEDWRNFGKAKLVDYEREER